MMDDSAARDRVNRDQGKWQRSQPAQESLMWRVPTQGGKVHMHAHLTITSFISLFKVSSPSRYPLGQTDKGGRGPAQ